MKRSKDDHLNWECGMDWVCGKGMKMFYLYVFVKVHYSLKQLKEYFNTEIQRGPSELGSVGWMGFVGMG